MATGGGDAATHIEQNKQNSKNVNVNGNEKLFEGTHEKAKRELLVQDILEVVKDKKSKGFYRLVVCKLNSATNDLSGLTDYDSVAHLLRQSQEVSHAWSEA